MVHRIINHPVHINQRNSKQLSPSSLIPVCNFGGVNIGIMIKEFNIPVCNLFTYKIIADQLCYEVDLNRFKDSFTNQILSQGLKLYIDRNLDRQYPRGSQNNNQQNDFMIHFGTLGKKKLHILIHKTEFYIYLCNTFVCLPAPLKLYGEGAYAISDVKEVRATKAFLGLNDQTKRCQTKESIEDCSSRLHLNMIRDQCHCVPFNLLNITTKVKF